MKINNSNKKYNFKNENQFYRKAERSRFEKFLNHYELLKLTKKIKGDIVEFGVFKGNSLIRLAHFRDSLKLNNSIYGFDTFSKFPKNNSQNFYDRKFPDEFKKLAGDPISKNKLEQIFSTKKIKKIKLVKGNIFLTINLLLKKKVKISFLHLDLDTEDVTKFVLEKTYKLVSKGGIIVFDDYKIHKGINKAVKKYFNSRKILKPIYGKNPHYIIKS